jgi:hypothetical protein
MYFYRSSAIKKYNALLQAFLYPARQSLVAATLYSK